MALLKFNQLLWSNIISFSKAPLLIVRNVSTSSVRSLKESM